MSFVMTIEDEVDVPVIDESDSEEVSTTKKPKKKKKASDLNAGFEWNEVAEKDQLTWDPFYQLQEFDDNRTSTADKIARVLEKRQKRKDSAERGPDRGADPEDEVTQLKLAGTSAKPAISLADLEESESETEASVVAEQPTKEKKVNSFFASAPESGSAITSFNQLSLSRALMKAISAMGYVEPSKIQARAIPVAMAGRDICASAATGSGKTAAFMLPILERLLFRPKRLAQTRILVLSPTRELAVQVCRESKSLARFTDITVGLAVGGMSLKIQEAELRKRPDIVVATPGRLVDHIHNTHSFDLSTVEVLILDEADRLLETGFSDELDFIVKNCPAGRQTMLFSATMTDQVEDLVKMSLHKPVRLFIHRNKQVTDNLIQEFVRIRPTREDDRDAITLALCKRVYKERTLVFVRAKKHAHRLRILFGLADLNATELHGSLTQAQRIEALDNFKEGSVEFLICTDLAGRGLDIPGVRAVVNWCMPNTIQQYIHRVGRTARAGMSGRSVTLVGDNERKLLRELHKTNRDVMKNRILEPSVVEKYKAFIDGLEDEIVEILREENLEADIMRAEMEVTKAQNMIEHGKEIYARPQRTWIQSAKEKAAAKEISREEHQGAGGRPMKNVQSTKKALAGQKRVYADPEMAKLMAAQGAAVRAAKREKKPKRMSVFTEDKVTGPAKKVKKQSGFAKELTDTSKKAVNEFRYGADDGKTSKDRRKEGQRKATEKRVEKKKAPPARGSKFKSKSRYKRR